MVEINLLVVISLYVLSFAIRGHEIHVQQGWRSGSGRIPRRGCGTGRDRELRIGISRRGDAEDDVVQTYFAVDEVEQCGNAAVEAYIRVLHFPWHIPAYSYGCSFRRNRSVPAGRVSHLWRWCSFPEVLLSAGSLRR